MRRFVLATALAALMLAGSTLAAAPAPATMEIKALPQEDVLAYIEELMRWQRDAAAIETTTATTRELLLQDSVQQNAVKILRSGFKFAKLEAALAPTSNDAPPSDAAASDATPELTPAQRMRQRVEENDNLIAGLQTQIVATRKADQRADLQGRLKLALAKQELYKSVLANMRNSSSTNAFGSQVEKLEQSVPELNDDAIKQGSAKATAAPVEAAAAVPAAANAHPTVSIFTLAGDMFTILRQQRDLRTFDGETKHLLETSRTLMKPLRTSLEDITTHGNSASVNDQVAAFNRIGSVLIPLGEAMFALQSSQAALDDWQHLLDQRLQETLRRFLIKLAILAFTIAIPLVIGEAVRRAIKQYIRDPKRQRQANTARRIIVACVVLFILLFNFISDFSSFATFAGFLTAGLAVALQSVLLSLIAHFFFYGRYGVRAGDRVNVAGVTGDILQIGMVRFYMRELKETADGKLDYTGKTVAFPNSILFQPSAFYKYIEG